jgi:hypothetical protein
MAQEAYRMTRRKDTFGWLVFAIALAAIVPSAASAYSVVLPSTPVVSGQRVQITATITNYAQSEQLGSADLVAPAGVVLREASLIDGPPAATASIANNVIHLRDESLIAGASRAVRITLDAPCAQGTTGWAVVAKQTPDFSGPTDLSLEPGSSALTTTARGSCSLAFVAQPDDVKIGQSITTAPFDPTAAPAAVALLDAVGHLSGSSGELVTVGLALGSAWGQLNGKKTVSAVNGIASFPGISVSRQGRYVLTASSPGLKSTVSARFRAEQVAVRCRNGVDCTATVTQTGVFGPKAKPYFVRADTTAPRNPDVSSDGGVLTLSFDTQLPLDCAGYTERSPVTAVVLGLNRRKVVALTMDKALLAANPGTLQMCVGVPYLFRTRAGSPAATWEDSDGDGVKDQWVGQLPSCADVDRRPPCVARRGTDSSGNPLVVARLKASPHDPRLRH